MFEVRTSLAVRNRAAFKARLTMAASSAALAAALFPVHALGQEQAEAEAKAPTQIAAAQPAPQQAAAPANGPLQLGPLRLEADEEQEVESPKYTGPLLDTPQTITVVPAETIRQQGLLNLRDILATAVPGITFTAGEGGGGYGDGINLRGYSANNDITVDGVRDSAQYTRSDPFNLEQIEITNGSNSVYSGSGSVAGNINIVSKVPVGQEYIRGTIGGGTDKYGRVTLDAEQQVMDDVFVRLNVMGHRNDVPGRDVEKAERWGVAPSVAFGIDTDTRVTLAYIHQHDKNVPQYGVPYYAVAGGLIEGAKSSNYYGYANLDKQQIDVDSFTPILNHDFNDRFSVRNLTRYQEVTQLSIVDPPQGTWCLASTNLTPLGASCAGVAPGFFLPSGPRGTTRDTKNTLLSNQMDFRGQFATGSLAHTAVLGFSFGNETYHLDTGNSLRNPRGVTPNPVLPTMNIADPNNVYSGQVNFIQTGFSDGELRNRAVYLFDNIALSEQFEFNGGIRLEHNEGKFSTATIAVPYPAPPALPVVTVAAPGRNEETLFSYRAGLVYKTIEEASLYVAYGNAQTPSQASVNGGCAPVSTSATNPATCNVKPEKARNIEIGGKWDFNGTMVLTAALFRNERTNYRVPSGDPLIPDATLDGRARVDGIALSATGRITDQWEVTANYTYLDSEVLQSVSDAVRESGGIDASKGNPLTGTPEHAFSLWTTHDVLENLTLGFGTTYQGSFYLNNAAPPLFQSDAYWLLRASASYRFNENIEVQLNVNNITDEVYYNRIRNNGWATPGDARSAILTVNFAYQSP